ncbi:ADOP family duplicated permease [Aliiglaciecola sp. CAU 1673]|uniref:ADOP family duplicated permease n=1 Tax=Aliiglaciecola sp. CAU 1673 TaxID=3032595 RepID=UPI0023DB27F6|nr:ADOP family duplicated permease [Aliiglaciecola sp. CAU 1673]MDF2177153.1 ADOP family duplicated permease [Aliiglaciecola sp. CAU 1673]
MNSFLDFKYALRLLLRNPGFSLLALLVITAGMAISIYLYSFLNSMMIKPLPFAEGERMVVVDSLVNGTQFNGGSMELHDASELKSRLQSLDEMGLYFNGTANVSGNDAARRFLGTFTEPHMFSFTQTQPLLGRTFTAQEALEGAKPVVVLGYDTWQAHFAGDPAILGRLVKINGEMTEVIGVMPSGYEFPERTELWLPLKKTVLNTNRGEISVAMFAKLKPGVSMAAANEEVRSIFKEVEAKFPQTNAGRSGYVTTYAMSVQGSGGDIITIMMFSVAGFILLLACINVGNLLLARANERAKEVAIRVALGAPRHRLVMQMMWESLIICVSGAVLSLLLAGWALDISTEVVTTFVDGKPFYWWKFGLDSDTMIATALITVFTIFMTGMLPALKASKSNVNSALRDGTRGALSKKEGRAAKILVTMEVALSSAVLILAGLMIISTYLATHIDYGVQTDNRLTARIGLTTDLYEEPTAQVRFFESLKQELQSQSSIKAVSLFSTLPGNYAWGPNVRIEDQEDSGKDYPRYNFVSVLPGSLAPVGIDLIEGRYLTDTDNADSLDVVLITQSLADKYWPGQSAIGKRLQIADNGNDTPWRTVVGVIEHVIHGQPTSHALTMPSIYAPVAQSPSSFLSVVIEHQGNEQQALKQLDIALKRLDREIPAYNIKSYQQVLDRNTAGIGFASKMFLVFGVVTLLLAISGIYGVMSNTITRRTQEIGVRRALGAQDSDVIKLYAWQGAKQLMIGLVIGLGLAMAIGLSLAEMLRTPDWVLSGLFIGIPLLIAVVVMMATLVPTFKALRLHPSAALRYE